MTVSTACASGATALGVAADLLRSDAADLVVAGGYDILCRFVMRGFDALRSLTRDRVRPFDRRRSGLLLGEGAALVLLARDRDAGERRPGRLLGHASARAAPSDRRSAAAALVGAGGYDILCRFVMRGFDALRSLTRDRVRPFDRRRSGLLLGEGAALVLLARDRDAGERRLGRLLGHASARAAP